MKKIIHYLKLKWFGKNKRSTNSNQTLTVASKRVEKSLKVVLSTDGMVA